MRKTTPQNNPHYDAQHRSFVAEFLTGLRHWKEEGLEQRRNIKLTLEYDGTNYAGWQAQTNALAVQTVLERELCRLLGETVRLTGAGRTDAGVHAAGQVANFRTDSSIPIDRLAVALNHRLPPDIVITSAVDAPETFHARFDAAARTYRYAILNRETPSAFHGRFAWHHVTPIPVSVWDALCRELVGKRDFSAFQKTGSDRKSPVCTVSDCRCWNESENVYVSITADSFLRGMVRAIVGTLRLLAPETPADLDAAQKRLHDILESRDRSKAGEAAPPQGLCLMSVRYES